MGVSAASMDSFSLKLSRHDDHNIEIKTVLELESNRFSGATEIFLFLPKSVQVSSWSRDTLFNDFRVRTRLSVPVRTMAGQTALQNTISHIATLSHENQNNEAFLLPDESMTEAAMRLASVVTETLKVYSRDHKKKIFLAHSLLAGSVDVANAVDQILESIQAVGDWMAELRMVVRNGRLLEIPLFRLLDEYLSYLFIQYVGELHRERDKEKARKEPHSGSEGSWQAFELVLSALQAKEVLHRKGCGYAILAGSSENEREAHLVRISQLKKYFQSTMFLDVAKQQRGKKISEPAAAVAAGLAALWAAFFQTLHKPELAGIGFKGVFLLGSGVVAYVLKDRIKDWAKQFLTKKAGRLFPDMEQVLMVDDEPIGTTQEWFSVASSKHLPKALRDLRHRKALSEVEQRLPEDVVKYRIDQDLRAVDRVRMGSAWAIQQMVRINLERYLRNMDDAYKEVAALADNGSLEPTRCHRAYYFYVVIRPRYLREATGYNGRFPMFPRRDGQEVPTPRKSLPCGHGQTRRQPHRIGLKGTAFLFGLGFGTEKEGRTFSVFLLVRFGGGVP